MRTLPGLTVLAILSVPSLGLVHAETWTVPGDHLTIQEAIDASQDGDEILVSPGIYVENIDFLGKAVTVQSTDGPLATVIDGSSCTSGTNQCSVVRMTASEGSDTILAGFTITGGLGSEILAPLSGAGGVLCQGSSPILTNLQITENAAAGGGGGVYCSFGASPTLISCSIIGNTAGFGGGLAQDGSYSVLMNCVLSNNLAFSADSGFGAGIFTLLGSLSLVNCTLYNNEAGVLGGAVFVYRTPTMIKNSIIWGSSPDELAVPVAEVVDVDHCNVEGGWPGEGNLSIAPLFLGPTTGDFHLHPNSPGVNQGSNDVDYLPLLDIDGDPRIVCARVDMGADEVADLGGPCLVRGDVNGDGQVGALLDALYLLDFGFGSGAEPPCLDAADADDDGVINAITDGIGLLAFGFAGGLPPQAPFPECGTDPTADSLSCASYSSCP